MQHLTSVPRSIKNSPKHAHNTPEPTNINAMQHTKESKVEAGILIRRRGTREVSPIVTGSFDTLAPKDLDTYTTRNTPDVWL